MLWLKNIMVIVQILSAFAIIGLVLLQQGKGAEMGASFGSGASGSLFGATGSANFLSRTTAVFAALFFICTLALTYLESYKTRVSAGLLSSPPAASAPAAASSPAATSAPSPSAPASGAAGASAPGQDVPK